MVSEDELLDAARYLREVRPLDPQELTQYVSEPTEPGEIREVLHAHAVDLGIRERADGRFEPVPDELDPPPFDGVDALPDDITAAVESLLVETFGSNWHAGESGDALREATRAFKAAYLAGESVEYDRATALGYAIYHLPGAFAKVQYPLAELAHADGIPGVARILEIGPGVGGSPLGMAAFLGEERTIDYRGIEPSEDAVSVCERLLETTHRNFHWELECAPIETTAITGEYDLIVLSNVLNELAAPADVLTGLVDHLADDGSLIAIAPADERTSRGLRATERKALAQVETLDVFAPTLRLWPQAQPTDDCWSFDRRDPIRVPSFQRKLDEGPRAHTGDRDPATGEFVNPVVQYAYSTLRTDGTRRFDVRPSRSRYAPLAETERHVGDRVNLAVVKLSHSLAEEDGHPVYVIGDGSQHEEHFAVHTRRTVLNETLAAAAYGSILSIEAALPLWNDEERAYNVVVDDETIVERWAGP